MQLKPKLHIGPWTLLERLGRGGNAEVWKATQEEGLPVALKVLHSFKPHREPYKRFQSEIEILQRLSHHPGIVPLLDYSLPDHPGEDDIPWLAMEIATPIRDALGSNPQLDEVVVAIASIAATLSELAAEDIFHRDVKPENLFKLGDNWGIGDFGIASFPEKEDLTKDNRKLGPMWYLAPEMLNNAAMAKAGPVDVYSLAKTLWVLGTGQNHPLPGQLRFNNQQTCIQSSTNHPRAAMLDVWIEKSTEDDPTKRPSMIEFRNELRAWLEPAPSQEGPIDISDLTANLYPYYTRSREQLEKRDAKQRFQKEAFEYVRQKIITCLEPYQHKCSELMGKETDQKRPVGTNSSPFFGQVDISKNAKIKASLNVSATYSTPLGAPEFFHIEYYGEIVLFLDNDGNITCQGSHIAVKGTNGGPVQTSDVWKQIQTAPIGTAQCEKAINIILAAWEANFRKGVEAFVSLVHSTK